MNVTASLPIAMSAPQAPFLDVPPQTDNSVNSPRIVPMPSLGKAFLHCCFNDGSGTNDGCGEFDSGGKDSVVCEACGHHRCFHVPTHTLDPSMGECKYTAKPGEHDGCQSFEPSKSDPKKCAGCNHHKSFHALQQQHQPMEPLPGQKRKISLDVSMPSKKLNAGPSSPANKISAKYPGDCNGYGWTRGLERIKALLCPEYHNQIQLIHTDEKDDKYGGWRIKCQACPTTCMPGPKPGHHQTFKSHLKCMHHEWLKSTKASITAAAAAALNAGPWKSGPSVPNAPTSPIVVEDAKLDRSLIKVGDSIPDVPISTVVDGKLLVRTTKELFAHKKIVLVGIPAPFSPLCKHHLDSFLSNIDQFQKKNVQVACISVCDAFVMNGWSRVDDPPGRVMMLADHAGELARSSSLITSDDPFTSDISFLPSDSMTASFYPMGSVMPRTLRFAMFLDDCIVKYLVFEAVTKCEQTTAQSVLSVL